METMERGGFTFVNWRKKKQSAVAATAAVDVLSFCSSGVAVAASYCEIKVYTSCSRLALATQAFKAMRSF